MKVLKQVVGIDVSQRELVVSHGKLLENLETKIKNFNIFENTLNGFKNLLKWVEENNTEGIPHQFVMEATGVYHEKFAYFLEENQKEVVILLPNKISNFVRSLDVKTITDKTASIAIAEFGLSRKLETWTQPHEAYQQLQQLNRERNQLTADLVVCKNRLHAEKISARPYEKTISRLEMRIEILKEQKKDILQDVKQVVEKYPEIKAEVNRLSSIPGISIITAVAVLAETRGFELIKNKSQLTSYAGLDVREKQSGTSVKAKPRISKKGNCNLRKSLYFPSITAVKLNDEHRALYHRIVSRTGIKMKGLVAVQRKLLELMYALFKNKIEYIPNYEEEKSRVSKIEVQYSTQASS